MEKRNINYPYFVDVKNIKVDNCGYDEKFRFILTVPFKSDGKKYLRVIMKNPSVASEQRCDMTMIKVCNAAYAAEFDGVVIMNLFPFRATNARDVYDKFYNSDKKLYEKAMNANKNAIRNACAGSDVVFAWGTNTICKTSGFDAVYDQITDEITEAALEYASSACSPCLDKSGKYPIHALRWWKEILTEGQSDLEPVSEKHLVLHRNMFGPSAEVCNTNSEDLRIYCYRKNEICRPRCSGCQYFCGDEQGLGIYCLWEDFDGNLSRDESVIQNYEKTLEYDRVQYAKKCFYKKDVDRYMEWIKNYEK